MIQDGSENRDVIHVKIGQDEIGVLFSRFPSDIGKKVEQRDRAFDSCIHNVAAAYYACLKERDRGKKKREKGISR